MDGIERRLADYFGARNIVDWWGTAITTQHVRDYFRTSSARFQLLLNRTQAIAKPGARVAEVGPAYGPVLLSLKQLGYAVTAYEMPECIASYAAVLQEECVPVVPWDIHMEDVEGSFDVVIASEVLEHLQISITAAIRKLKRLLAPGGTLLITVPNAYNLPNILRIVRGVNIQEPFTEAAAVKSGVVIDSRTHPREPVLGELLQAAQAAGLTVTHRGHFNTLPRPVLRRLAYALAPNSWKDHLHVEAQIRL
jgi:2-polyprenyl-3-methyl-5-hydroxy-6-metoxy-1,4-benzoquinol methylase